MVSGVDDIGIASRDPEHLASFYARLGFAITYRSERGITLQTGNAKLFIFQAASSGAPRRVPDIFRNPPGFDHISLLCENVDATYHELHAQGIEFISPPADQTWGARTAPLEDPDGNLLSLIQWLTS
jgi:catechol 2,3-dioxygenase-like lactoylglutathione lyase family enzyme